MRQATKIAIVLAALAACLVPVSQAAAAPPAPAWQLNLLALPTNLAPGTTGTATTAPIYEAIATNIGAGNATGPVTLKATLPVGVTPVFDASAPAGQDSDSSVPDPTCSKTPSQTVICTAVGPVHPSRNIAVRIPVEVSGSLVPGEALADATASVESPGTTPVTTKAPTTIDTEPPPFGFLDGALGLSTLFTEEDGSPSLAAGSHPDQLTVDVGFPVEQPGGSGLTTGAGHPRDIFTDLPQGVIVNPAATAARCTEVELLSGNGSNPGCPATSQVGMATVVTEVNGPQPAPSAVYNMVPPPGSPATLAFNAANVGIYVHLKGGVRSDGDYGLSAESTDTLARGSNPLEHVQVQLWGDPTSSSHDQIRDECRIKATKTCQVEPKDTAFLTMPSACTGPLTTAAHARSWEEAEEGIEGLPHTAEALSTDTEGNPVGVSGCSLQDFEPTISAKPTTNLADSPSGLDFTLHQPQDQQLGHIAPANLKDATVTLPKGLVVNPSQASGLAACSQAQIGYLGDGHYSKDKDNCPDAAKIGSVEVTTPLLDHSLPGSVYIAKPFENEFDRLLAIYLVIDDAPSGTVAKLAGEVIPDPNTGQLTNRFEENPQLPLEDVELHLFSGSRAALITPQVCGTHTTTTDLTPWSTPEGQDAHPTDSFQTTASPSGACPSNEGDAPNAPAFSAGTVLPQAGAYTPFVLKLSRADGTQRLTGFDTTLPPGLTGKLAGVAECSEAQLAQAASRSNPSEGTLEQQSPSCPASSAVGVVNVAAGAGPTPFHTQGTAYLAGPYKGAPLSMAVITPAVAGPFDLGVVVVRAALYVDPVSTRIHAVSDPFPQILHGIPLDLRSADVELSRNQFTLNPTSCDPFSIEGSATSALGAIAPLSSRFQVGGCSGLGFEPKLALRLKGKTKRGGFPALKTTYTPKPGDANLSNLVLRLPKSEFIEQGHFGTICTRVQFAAGQGHGTQCPANSVYGKITATTPLLDQPLEGPVFLRSSNHNLPDVVFALHGKIDAEVAVRVDSVGGGLRASVEGAPDVPITKVVLEMAGGKKGLFVNSRDICATTYKATVQSDGQNGKVHDFKAPLKAQCKKARKHKKTKSHR